MNMNMNMNMKTSRNQEGQETKRNFGGLIPSMTNHVTVANDSRQALHRIQKAALGSDIELRFIKCFLETRCPRKGPMLVKFCGRMNEMRCGDNVEC